MEWELPGLELSRADEADPTHHGRGEDGGRGGGVGGGVPGCAGRDIEAARNSLEVISSCTVERNDRPRQTL